VALSEVRAVLARGDFRVLLATRLTGQFADGLLQAALATFVLFSPERQTSATAVAAAFAVLLLPYSLVGPFAGILLDRWRRRNVLVRANLVRALSCVPLMALVVGDRADAWLGLAVLVTVGLGRFVLAGLSASLPHVVEPRHLVLANSYKPTAGTIAYAAGAFAGVVVRGLAGGGDDGSLVVLGVTAICYFAAGLIPLRLAAGHLGPSQEAPTHTVRQVLYEFAGGARELAAHPAAGKSLVTVFVNRFLVGALTLLLLLVLRNRIHPPDQPDAALADFAVVAAGLTVGALLAALLTPRFGRSLGPVQWTSLVALGAAAAVTPSLFAVALVPMVLAAPFVGLSNQSSKICSDSILQARIPDEALGRVFSLVDLAVNLGLVLGVTAVAFLAPPDGVTPIGYLLIGAGFAAVAAWYFLTRDPTLDSDPVFGLATGRAARRSAG
jgi:MFS family permease